MNFQRIGAAYFRWLTAAAAFTFMRAVLGKLSARSQYRIAAGVLLLCVIVLACWRVDCVLAGPDPDSDAYGHHIIARKILIDPHDLRVHWVWLPLFHYLQALAILVGADLDAIRLTNVVVWAVVPILLFDYLRQRCGESAASGARPAHNVTPLVAALLCGMAPIGMQMGTTGQIEPGFTLAILGFAIAMERRHYWLAAIVVTLACLLRYEGWFVVAATGAVLALRAWRLRQFPWADGREGMRPYAAVLLPCLVILGWAIAHLPHDEHLFGFVTETRSFANDATKATNSFDLGFGQFLKDLKFYAFTVPRRAIGPALLIAPFGILRTARRYPWLTISGAAALGFLTLAWLLRASLGLERHFVVMLPLYATFIAVGVEVLAEWLMAAWRALQSWGVRTTPAMAPLACRAALTAAVLAVTWVALDNWMGDWRAYILGGWKRERAVASYLRSLPQDRPIFCNDAVVEVLSDLDRNRFVRRWQQHPAIFAYRNLPPGPGVLYLVTNSAELAALRPAPEILFRFPPLTDPPQLGNNSMIVTSVAYGGGIDGGASPHP